MRLADYAGKRPVVVFFYPKDGTPICLFLASDNTYLTGMTFILNGGRIMP